MTPACHPAHPTSAPFKSHSQGPPSSRCIESAHALQCDPRFLAGGASDTALGLLDNLREGGLGDRLWPGTTYHMAISRKLSVTRQHFSAERRLSFFAIVQSCFFIEPAFSVRPRSR